MNAFLDSAPVSIVATLAVAAFAWSVFWNTSSRQRVEALVEGARRRSEGKRPDPTRVRRVWLLLRQASLVLTPALITAFWSTYPDRIQTISLGFAVATLGYVWWRSQRARPPRFVMPGWFREHPEW